MDAQAVAVAVCPDEALLVRRLQCSGRADEAALWINGRHVLRNKGDAPLAPDWERWPIHLNAGRNRVWLKIANNRGDTGFCLRLTDIDGQPIDGLTLDMDPPSDLPATVEPK